MRSCKVCKVKFEQLRPLQMVCSPSCALIYSNNLRLKKWKSEKREIKEGLKSFSKHLNELQALVNTFVRLRDKNEACVSCGGNLGQKYDAGHYYSVGGHSGVRFDLRNIHGQCVHCNQHLHGNLIEYRKGLIDRIGQDEFDKLSVDAYKTVKYSLSEVIEMKKKYKKMIVDIKKFSIFTK